MFQGAFRGVVNLATQATLAGRTVDITGPPLGVMFVSGQSNQVGSLFFVTLNVLFNFW